MLNTIKAVVNMTNVHGMITNTERRGLIEIKPHCVTSLPDWNIPWCSSYGEYAEHHLELVFGIYRYNIWQQDYIRFTNDSEGFLLPDAHPGSRRIARSRNGYTGYPVVPDKNEEVCITIDERFWVIVNEIGYHKQLFFTWQPGY